MKIETIKNKDGQVMTTKDGVELKDYIIEVGDTFIPQANNIFERKNQVSVNGEQKIITNYRLCVKAKNADGSDVESGEDVWITLTPTQAKSIQKKIDNAVIITQHLFIVYEYTNDFGAQVGVGIKQEQVPAKSFEDF